MTTHANGSMLDSILHDVIALQPTTEPGERQFALHLYRLLARGRPVRREDLAQALNRPTPEVYRAFERWPSVIQLDEHRRVIGFGGLTIRPTRHRLTVDGTELYTWCAWDSLFIPAIVGQRARVESTCPQTGAPILLIVSRDGVSNPTPLAPVMSLPQADPDEMREDVRRCFCQRVHFFESAEAGAAWARRRNSVVLVSLEQAFELGRRKNVAQFGTLLEEIGPAATSRRAGSLGAR